MARFRKKPVEIEAVQWDGSLESIQGICRWANDGEDEPIVSYLTMADDVPFGVLVDTLNGPVKIEPAEWVVKGVQGEFYPCKPDIFDATYEPVDA